MIIGEEKGAFELAILVTGGAGYIGSHTVLELRQAGEEVVVVDNLVKGHREAVRDLPFYEVDIRERAKIIAILKDHHVDTVVHFAASSLVGESMVDPLKYYEDNVGATATLLQALVEADVKQCIFSSTAATYGEPIETPITEEHPTVPTNPYGETKLAIEKMLEWSFQAYGLKSIRLRYFNAAGAHPDLAIGEDHEPETHLIPIILQVPLQKREHVMIYGDDYATPDGSCLRDYIHVMDLASAHRLAVKRVREEGIGSEVYNLGNGKGFSVKEVIEAARVVTGHPIPAKVGDRRQGDPAVLVASSQLAKEKLGWQPQYNDLQTIISDAWRFHQEHPHGYTK